MPKRCLNLWHRKDFLAPTPSVHQPLFETSEFVPGFHQVFVWDKFGENLGQTRVSPYFTHWKPGKPGFVPGTSPGLCLGQTRGRRAAQKVYVTKKSYVPFFAR